MKVENLLKKILKGEKVNRFLVLKNEKELLYLCKSCEERSTVLVVIDQAIETL